MMNNKNMIYRLYLKIIDNNNFCYDINFDIYKSKEEAINKGIDYIKNCSRCENSIQEYINNHTFIFKIYPINLNNLDKFNCEIYSVEELIKE